MLELYESNDKNRWLMIKILFMRKFWKKEFNCSLICLLTIEILFFEENKWIEHSDLFYFCPLLKTERIIIMQRKNNSSMQWGWQKRDERSGKTFSFLWNILFYPCKKYYLRCWSFFLLSFLPSSPLFGFVLSCTVIIIIIFKTGQL